MQPSAPKSVLLALSILGATGSALANDETVRVYNQAFFGTFSPQTALEIIERLPGFTLQEADDERGLGLGGTNVLLNGRPITGKGEAATNQIAQITVGSVVRVEVRDASSLDLPGYSGLVANIVTQNTNWGGSWQWNPEFKESSGPALANGSINLSGNFGSVSTSLVLNSTSVRVDFEGPETLVDSDGSLFEDRFETFSILGDQPALSASLGWSRLNGEVFNAKGTLGQLDVHREQVSRSRAITDLGITGLNTSASNQLQTSARFDADYTFNAFGGSLKLISVASIIDDDVETRLIVDDADGFTVRRAGFDEVSQARELVSRFEHSWGTDGRNWQLAGEGALNTLDLETERLSFGLESNDTILDRAASVTTIEETRAELTLTHSRSLSERHDLQLSVGSEVSKISQGSIEREFFRPKGFVAYTMRPNESLTLIGRLAREVGQLRFRDFAASVSLFDGIESGSNAELVPQQSWLITGRAEHRFDTGHILSIEVEHQEISDLVDRIPLAAGGDAVGNIPEARRTLFQVRGTILGAPFGLDGAQLDLWGSWIASNVQDPVEDFDRDINATRQSDIRVDFRHDISGSNWSYGFTLQDIQLSPVYRANLVQTGNTPAGGLTPGQNIVFVEHRDILGLRARFSVSEFIGHESEFTRTIFEGRRDVTDVNRIESRSRSLQGPYFRLGLGRTF